jgi:P-type E1-E2 ATPase
LQFRSLNDQKENIQLSVVRGGERKTVSIYDLVVGDIVPLSIGGQVPADGLLVEGHSLSIDESTMTGESHPVSFNIDKHLSVLHAERMPYPFFWELMKLFSSCSQQMFSWSF